MRFAGTPDEGHVGSCETIAAPDSRGDLASITAPALAIAATAIRRHHPAGLQEIAGGVSGAPLLVVARGLHLANVEGPRR